MMENIIILVIVAAIIAGIVRYLYRAKKRGETCIGCPYAKQCARKKGAEGGCSSGCCSRGAEKPQNH